MGRLFLGIGGELGRLDLLTEFLYLVDAVLATSQLVLDRFDLLVEVVLFLRLFHLFFDAVLDLLVNAQLFDFFIERLSDLLEPVLRRSRFEQRLFFLDGKFEVPGNRIGQPAGIGDAHGRKHRLVGQPGRVLDEPLEQATDLGHLFLDLGTALDLEFDAFDEHVEGAVLGGLDLQDAAALNAFDEQLDVAVGQLEMLHDRRDRTDGVDIVGSGVVVLGVALRRQEHTFVGIEGTLDRQERTLPSHDERHHRIRENDDIPQRHHRQLLDGTTLGALAALFHNGSPVSCGPRQPAIPNRGTRNRRKDARRVYPAFSITSNGVLPPSTTSLVITTSFTSF